MGQIFLRRKSMDFITFANHASPVEVDIPSQQPQAQFDTSIQHFTEYTNISTSGILQYEIWFGSCLIIFAEFSPERKSDFVTATYANHHQPSSMILDHKNMFSSKVFSPVLTHSSQNQTFTTSQSQLHISAPFSL